MPFLKSIAIPAAVGASICGIIVASAPAEAYEYREGNILGYRAEVADSGSFSQPDLLTVYGPYGREEIIVTCAPYEWASTGPNTQAFVEQIAQEWCF